MGWGRMMLLGNVGQQLDIQDLENAISQMQADVARTQNLDRTQEQSIDELTREVHELKLYLATLVKLLVARGVIRQEEVGAAVQAVEGTGA
jgi:peptidoglycan hydrolase CwlO-like protein